MIAKNELLRVKFHIIDNEFGDEYNYVGHFKYNSECCKFILENKQAGNTIEIIETKIIPADSVDLNQCADFEF